MPDNSVHLRRVAEWALPLFMQVSKEFQMTLSPSLVFDFPNVAVFGLSLRDILRHSCSLSPIEDEHQNLQLSASIDGRSWTERATREAKMSRELQQAALRPSSTTLWKKARDEEDWSAEWGRTNSEASCSLVGDFLSVD